MLHSPISRLRTIACMEGVSFLVLLGIAMPLKYALGMPLAVKYVGWAHGVFFILFCAALCHATLASRWSLARATVIFIAALIPFGPFLIDRRFKEFEAELKKTS